MDAIILFLLVILNIELFREVKKRGAANKKELEFVEKMSKEYREFRAFKHDYQNILISLSGYIEEKDLEGLEKFFYEEIFDTNPMNNLRLINYGMVFNILIPEIRGIILSKITEAESKNITIGVECRDKLTELQVNKIKMVRILGILLDNALEGTSKCENPKVSIAFENSYDETQITIVNNCLSEDINGNIFGYGISSKGKNRGIGLYNVGNMIKKINNISLDTKYINNYFIQEITIKNRYH
ncbi:MAG: sensor histidine kinase [Sarcina sp.]